MENLEFKSKFDIDDYVYFNKHVIYKTNKGKRSFWLLGFLSGLFILMGLYISNIYLLAFGVAIIVIVFILPHLITKNIKKMYNSSPFMGLEEDIVINEEGIFEASKASTLEIKWDNVFRIDENDLHIYVFISMQQAIIINKKIVSIEDINACKELFIKYVPEDKLNLISKDLLI